MPKCIQTKTKLSFYFDRTDDEFTYSDYYFRMNFRYPSLRKYHFFESFILRVASKLNLESNQKSIFKELH